MSEHPVTLPALLERLVERSGTAPFVAHRGEVLGAEQFAARVRVLAAGFAAHGVGHGDRVAVLLPTGIDQAAAVFACGALGALAVIVHPRLKDAQITHVLHDCTPKLVLTDAVRRAGLSDPTALLEDFEVVTPDQVHDAAAAKPPESIEVAPSDAAAILYTSGSTGRSKGIVQSHGNLCDGARIVSTYLGLRPDDHLLAVLPLSFDYGLNQLLAAAFTGCRITLLQYLTIGEVIRTLVAERCTVLAGVPEIWIDFEAAVGADPDAQRALTDLRLVTNTGGRLPVRVIEWFHRVLPHVQVFSMYGLTEAFRSSFVPPEELARHPRSIGKAVPEVELLVIDPATGKPCAPGEVGELVHCGAFVALGYWNRPEETAARFRPHPLRPESGERCVFSGDLVRVDEEGYFEFVGRRDALIKVEGHRISPDEVTEVVMSVPGVARAGAVGLPTGSDAVPRLVVCVVPDRTASRDELPAQVIAACRRVLPGWMVPAEVRLVDSLPLGPNHKVDHEALRRSLEEAGP